jgi:putative oxidoreductase
MMKLALSRPVEARTALELVRVASALILGAHSVHALFHPDDVRVLADALASHGVPATKAVSWVVVLGDLLCSLGLLVRVWVVPSCLGHLAVLCGAVGLFEAPRWYALGGNLELGEPGAEYSALMAACVAAIGVAYYRGGADADASRAERGLDVVRVAAAFVVLTHPGHAFLTLDIEGIRGFGEAMEARGWPLGVPLVCAILGVQTVCSVALLVRRFVVAACVGEIVVLGFGIPISHWRHGWFVVGPGEEGMEFSVMLIACFLAVLAARGGQRRSR